MQRPRVRQHRLLLALLLGLEVHVDNPCPGLAGDHEGETVEVGCKHTHTTQTNHTQDALVRTSYFATPATARSALQLHAHTFDCQ
jgi:hypothetical protein